MMPIRYRWMRRLHATHSGSEQGSPREYFREGINSFELITYILSNFRIHYKRIYRNIWVQFLNT